MSEFRFNLISELKKEGYDNGVLSTVIKSGDGTPRHLGAKMIVLNDGRTVGTISGGTMEYAVIKRSRELFDTKDSVVFRYELKDDLGMLCGGAAHILLEYITF